jgi:hypothetical protein
MMALIKMIGRLLADLIGFAVLSLRSRDSLAAENLFLRRQLALFKERSINPRGRPYSRSGGETTPSRRVSMSLNGGQYVP